MKFGPAVGGALTGMENCAAQSRPSFPFDLPFIVSSSYSQPPAMLSTFTFAAGVIASTYLFLHFLLRLTQDAREPRPILTTLPFINPLIGMIKEKSRFHVRLRLVL
jgi:hypothetical protein